ncbi:lysophospholipid acyltransferase family protein [Flavobacteriaceae bacterium M23B6Z8]
MQFLIYILVYPFLWLISILPFPLFYKFSDAICFLVYRIIKYRRKVVRRNLELSFPKKSSKELSEIEKKFYSHMCDLFLEMIKSLSISKKEIQKRFRFKNLELIRHYERENRNVILVCGHYASYEWMVSLGYEIKHKGFAIYTPLANKYFDKLVQKIRMRHEAYLLSRYTAVKDIKKHKEQKILAMYGFASDQSPSPKRAKYWRTFMGVTVPVFTGAEFMAKETDCAVIFLDIQKIKRGYYETTFKLIADKPNEFEDYEITDIFTALLEEQIKAKPEFYLWTHKRFKHMGKEPKGLVDGKVVIPPKS